MAEKQSEKVELGGIKVTSLEEAKNLEAQGFLTPQELEDAKNKFKTPRPETKKSTQR